MWQLLRKYPCILIFGVLQIFFTAPGQTFFISFFVLYIFQDIGISHSCFAGIYSLATITASLFLTPAGRFIDKYSLKTVLTGITTCMAAGCFLLASSKSLSSLFFGFFILRLFGQGVFGLTGNAVMAKSFEKNRGKAMGITTLGFPLSEAVYPSIALILLYNFGWRQTYLILGLSTLFIMLPVQLFLISKSPKKQAGFLPGEKLESGTSTGRTTPGLTTTDYDFSLSEALRDIKFYLIIIASCVPPVVMTGLLFHQTSVFQGNYWPVTMAGSGLTVYAVCKAVSSIITGPLVDKHGPFILFGTMILMIAFGTLLTACGGPAWIMYIYFAVMGAALGAASPIVNVVFASLYGTKHIGSIKGFVQTFRNGLTALGPLPVALAMDTGISITFILYMITISIFILWSRQEKSVI